MTRETGEIHQNAVIWEYFQRWYCLELLLKTIVIVVVVVVTVDDMVAIIAMYNSNLGSNFHKFPN